MYILMAKHKTAVTPFVTHWSYCSFTISPWYIHVCSKQFSIQRVNSLIPGRGGNNFEIINLELIFWIDILGDSYKIVLWRMPMHQIHDNSTLVQVMVWCHQATSHYLSRCWPSSLLPHGVTSHNELSFRCSNIHWALYFNTQAYNFTSQSFFDHQGVKQFIKT